MLGASGQGEDISGHATHRQMVLGAYTHTVSLLSLNSTHEHTTQTNAHEGTQANKQARTLNYVRVYEATQGCYADAMLLELGQKQKWLHGMTRGRRKRQEQTYRRGERSRKRFNPNNKY